MIATPTSTAPHPLTSHPSVTPSPTPLTPLSPRDESLLLSLQDSGPSLAFLIRQANMTLQEALSWWSQPHIKAALAQLTDLAQARAKAIAANDATHAVTALQSCTVLADTEFYEQADPKTRLKAFESARKAAGQVLRLAGIPCAGAVPSAAVNRGSTAPAPFRPAAAVRDRSRPTGRSQTNLDSASRSCQYVKRGNHARADAS